MPPDPSPPLSVLGARHNSTEMRETDINFRLIMASICSATDPVNTQSMNLISLKKAGLDVCEVFRLVVGENFVS